MGKALQTEKKRQQEIAEKQSSLKEINERKEIEQEAQRKLDTEILHQREEAERRALGQAMMSDAAKNRPSLSNSCLNLLNNYQGNINFIVPHFFY